MTVPDFQSLAQPGIQRLRAYDPGHDLVALRQRFTKKGSASVPAGKTPEATADGVLIEMGSNENTYGPSPRAREALLATLHELHRYPDPLGGELKLALASYHGLDTAQILLGNGSHELLMMLAQVFAGPDTDVVASQYGFAVYALAAQAAGANLRQAAAYAKEHPMSRGHSLAAITEQIGPKTRLVYLANPNNPTGTWFTTEELEWFLTQAPENVLVVVDEAYIEFVTDPALNSSMFLLESFPNLIVARTFSKGYALAGLRVGFIAAHPELVAVMERVRESFNVNLPGLAAARAALYDQDHLDWVCDNNAEERVSLARQLRARGLFVPDSQTNFLLVDFGKDAAKIEEALVNRGVVSRPMGGYGLPTCLRITVGTRDENRRLLQALDRVLP
jgi:histidinol-phosphate aminotransferase